MLVGKEASRTAVSGLNFIQNQQTSVFVAKKSEPVDEFFCRFINARNTLDTLDDDSSKSAS